MATRSTCLVAAAFAAGTTVAAAQDAPVRAMGEVHGMTDTVVNLTHEPIPEIGWPTMTMDLAILDGADVSGIKPGDRVRITLEKGADGMYAIRALEPVESK